jgi:hypothetical protein
MGLSSDIRQKLHNRIFNSIALQPPTVTSTTVSLHTGDPGNSGLNEVTAGLWPSYARQTVNTDGATLPFWSAAAGVEATVDNYGNVSYGTFDGGSDITVTHVAIWDQSNNLLGTGTIGTSGKLLQVDAPVQITSGALDIKLVDC